MKKFNLKCFALVISAFAFQESTAQEQADIIIGEPDVYQDYIILNTEVDNTVSTWEIATYEQTYDTNTETVKSKLLGTERTKELIPYFRIDSRYRKNNKNLKVKVVGLNKTRRPVIVDEWIAPVSPDHINNEPFCWKACVAKTYAFEVVINERVDLSGQVQEGHTVTFRDYNVSQEGGGYIPTYRHLSSAEATNIHNNSSLQCADDLTETYCHYGIESFNVAEGIRFSNPDGVKIIERENVTEEDGLKNKNGGLLTGTVYSIQKGLGKWQSQVAMSDVLANDPGSPCGSFGTSITAMMNYANGHLDLDDNLVCDGYSPNSTGDELPPYVWSDIHGKNGKWIEWDEDIYDVLKFLAGKNNGNSTGVSWWPSDDVRQIQLINIKKGLGQQSRQDIITLYRDSIYNADGEPNYNSLNLKKGLYNILLVYSDGRTFPLILDKTKTSMNKYPHKNFLKANISPNPTISGNITASLNSPVTLHFDYKIMNARGVQVYSKPNSTILKDEQLDLIIPENNLPKGRLLHVFEMSDGSSVSYTTIKR